VTVLATALGLMGGIGRLEAADPVAPVIAMIDVQAVLRQSLAAQGIQRQIEAEREAYHEILQKQEEKLRAADAELNRARASLSNEEYRLKRTELEASVASVRRELQERKRDLDQSMINGMAQVRAKLVEVVAEIAKERGINLVILKSAIFLGTTDLEITQEALERLNERLPAVVPKASDE
jgi:outer membrane protein